MAVDLLPEGQRTVTWTEAKKAGLKYYFTGKPCKNGHIVTRSTSRLMCRQCILDAGKSKEWHRKNLELSRAQIKAWRLANADRMKATKRAWYASNSDQVKLRAREYAKKNKDIINLKSRENNKLHPEKSAAKRERRKEKIKLSVQSWKSRNRGMSRVYESNRRARLAESGGSFTKAELSGLLLRQKYKCVYCYVSLKGGYEVDHIMPISKGGSGNIGNIQALCGRCNARKYTKHPIDFAQSFGMLL